MNVKTITCLLICVTVFANAADEKKLELSNVHFVLHEQLKDNEKAIPILSNLQSFVQLGPSTVEQINVIGSNIVTLTGLLNTDQTTDDETYNTKIEYLNEQIRLSLEQIDAIKLTRQGYYDVLTSLDLERQEISRIFQQDNDAYSQRVSKNSDLKDILEELITQATQQLVNNPNVPAFLQKEGSKYFSKIKQIGKGHPIEALVQIAKIFSQSDATSILNKFQALLDAVQKCLDIDLQKQTDNLALYNTLTNNIDNVLVPGYESNIAAANRDIKGLRIIIQGFYDDITRITKIYNDRKTERANAIAFSTEASSLLTTELAALQNGEPAADF